MADGDSSRLVLVLEDSILVALAIEAALADRGYEAIVAGSLAAAEERLARQRPAAALLDVHLPDGNSLTLARKLAAAGCRVALCSGVDADMIPDGFEFAARFRKPVAAGELAEWVASTADAPGS